MLPIIRKKHTVRERERESERERDSLGQADLDPCFNYMLIAYSSIKKEYCQFYTGFNS